MNLAFCNQEKQRNEVCLYIFSLYFLLARVLKPVETLVPVIWFVRMHDSNALLRYYILYMLLFIYIYLLCTMLIFICAFHCYNFGCMMIKSNKT
jgi:hypothetical protein